MWGDIWGVNDRFELAEITDMENIQKVIDINKESPHKTEGINTRIALYKLKNGKNVIENVNWDDSPPVFDNQQAIENNQFLETDFNKAEIMLVRTFTETGKADVSLFSNQDDIKTICNDMKAKTRKIELGANRIGFEGNILLLDLNDNLPENVRQDFEKMTDVQLNWLFVNGAGLKNKYGKMFVMTIIDDYCMDITKKYNGTSVSTLLEEFNENVIRRIDGL